MKYSNRPVIAVFIIVLALLSCKSDNSALIATVGPVSISENEFQRRFNFNYVFPPEVPLSTQKELVLSSLLAEKVLSVYSHPDSLSSEIQIAREQTWREVLIEELRLDSVERRIKILEPELRREYDKSLWDINIKYLAFNDSSEAWQFHEKSTSLNRTFETTAHEYLVQKGFQTSDVPERKIIWGNESAELENKVYSMADGQINSPFFVYGQYYVIKCIGAVPNVSATPQNFETRRQALREKLFKERAREQYKTFYKRQVFPVLGAINWKHLQPIYEQLVSETQFDSKQDPAQALNKPMGKEVYLNRMDAHDALMKSEAVRFNSGETMTVDKVLERLAFGPYVFDYSTVRNLKKSFFNMVHLMVEHEAILKVALDNDYANKQSSKNKMEEWDSYYSATGKKYSLLKAGQNKNSQDVLDEFLMKKSAQLDIIINSALLENIELQPVGVLVRKSHFANRLMAAPVHNFMGLRSWEKYIKTLLLTTQS